MGEMIGNIAHQWRQPLSVISTSATGLLMQQQYNSDVSKEDLEKHCNAINDNAQYLSKTIDDFKNFIKNDRQLVRFNLNDNIESFISLVEPSLKKENIKLILNIDKSFEIESYPNELIQCFMNIFNNAKDALKDSTCEDKYIFIEVQKKDNSMVINFKDNAGGISKDILARIFEPYFTTKHQAQGTGLGLSMTYNLIVDGMKGTIEASNVTYDYNEKEYMGAKFTITLPLK
jgi:signal transduction histidine kinase